MLSLLLLCLSLPLPHATIPSEDPDGEQREEIPKIPMSPSESFQSLDSSEESPSACRCTRIPKFITIGVSPDLSTELSLDVGECSKSCWSSRPSRPLKREEFDEYLRKWPELDPLEIYLSLQSRIANPNATNSENSGESGGCTCRASSLRRELHFTPSPKEFDVLESCECEAPTASCNRLSKKLKLHGGTPFEREVDVGECSGGGISCSPHHHHTHHHCSPIRKGSLGIEGPNGISCIETVEECSCLPPCYRMKRFLQVFDYSNSTHGSPLTKMIDIGGCHGSCGSSSSAPLTSKCLPRMGHGGVPCLSMLVGGRAPCSPDKYVSYSYRDGEGAAQSVSSILSCTCTR